MASEPSRHSSDESRHVSERPRDCTKTDHCRLHQPLLPATERKFFGVGAFTRRGPGISWSKAKASCHSPLFSHAVVAALQPQLDAFMESCGDAAVLKHFTTGH